LLALAGAHHLVDVSRIRVKDEKYVLYDKDLVRTAQETLSTSVIKTTLLKAYTGRRYCFF
jgi:hypothetical protein